MLSELFWESRHHHCSVNIVSWVQGRIQKKYWRLLSQVEKMKMLVVFFPGKSNGNGKNTPMGYFSPNKWQFCNNANTHTCIETNISIMLHIFVQCTWTMYNVHGIWCLLDQLCMKEQLNVVTKFPTSFHAPRNAVHPSEIQFHWTCTWVHCIVCIYAQDKVKSFLAPQDIFQSTQLNHVQESDVLRGM